MPSRFRASVEVSGGTKARLGEWRGSDEGMALYMVELGWVRCGGDLGEGGGAGWVRSGGELGAGRMWDGFVAAEKGGGIGRGAGGEG